MPKAHPSTLTGQIMMLAQSRPSAPMMLAPRLSVPTMLAQRPMAPTTPTGKWALVKKSPFTPYFLPSGGEAGTSVLFQKDMNIDSLTWDFSPGPGVSISQISSHQSGVGTSPLLDHDAHIGTEDSLKKIFGVPDTKWFYDTWMRIGGSWLSGTVAQRTAWVGALDFVGYHDAARFVNALIARGDLSPAVRGRNVAAGDFIVFYLQTWKDAAPGTLSFRFSGSDRLRPKFGGG